MAKYIFVFCCTLGIILLTLNYTPDKIENGMGKRECYVERFYTFRSTKGFRNISFSNGIKSISYPKYDDFSVCFSDKPVTVTVTSNDNEGRIEIYEGKKFLFGGCEQLKVEGSKSVKGFESIKIFVSDNIYLLFGLLIFFLAGVLCSEIHPKDREKREIKEEDIERLVDGTKKFFNESPLFSELRTKISNNRIKELGSKLKEAELEEELKGIGKVEPLPQKQKPKSQVDKMNERERESRKLKEAVAENLKKAEKAIEDEGELRGLTTNEIEDKKDLERARWAKIEMEEIEKLERKFR